MKFCKYCSRDVRPLVVNNGTNWIKCLVLTLITGGFALVFYIPYWFFRVLFGRGEKVCPICNAKL
ncbi:hypothetical protein SATMO3_12170 [Sporomusa aerivorans]